MDSFRSPSKGKMSFEEVITDILDYINEDKERTYKLIVGSDSQPREEGTCFVSAIIIHREGKGARYYYKKLIENKIRNMRQRIFYEASLSLTLADRISQYLKDLGRDMEVEIHLDVGNQGETRDMVKEIIGMVVGSGFDARIKPDASAASTVADKYTK